MGHLPGIAANWGRTDDDTCAALCAEPAGGAAAWDAAWPVNENGNARRSEISSLPAKVVVAASVLSGTVAPARHSLTYYGLQRMRIHRGLGIMAGGGVALRLCCVGYVALLYGRLK